MTDHTTPADQPSLRADIDTPEFRKLINEWHEHAEEARYAYSAFASQREAMSALIAHISAHTTRAVEAAVAAATKKETQK